MKHVLNFINPTKMKQIIEKLASKELRLNIIATNLQNIIELALAMGAELGKWEGQVELEEHYDRQQYSESAIESIYSRKTSTPLRQGSVGNQVTVSLRSQQWRDGVRETVKKRMEEYTEMLINLVKNT